MVGEPAPLSITNYWRAIVTTGECDNHAGRDTLTNGAEHRTEK